jgi:ribosomal protein S12 methylthiotransferase
MRTQVRYFLDPFGCVKNQVDAENMMAFLDRAGWSAASDAESADLIIVNSCGFIESAKRESINAVLGWRKQYPNKKILLAGCLSQRYAKELAESLPEADSLFGNSDLAGIVEAAAKLAPDASTDGTSDDGVSADGTSDDGASTDGVSDGAFSRKPDRNVPGQRPLLSLPGSAYVKISEGCDNRCSFCAIPLIRGGLRCRAIPDILEECKGLLERGVRELCIIGQDIGAYRSGGALPELLKAIASLEGRFWVRLLYIHPDHFPLPILDIMEQDKRFLPYFDIPFQHAAPEILAAMNRRGRAETYLALLETIRRRLPAAVIRSTFLLGFPGETEADFAALLDFQEQARLDWLGCFTWSREEGTVAGAMKGRVSKKTAAERKRIVEERQVPITEQNMERFVGQTLDLLLEEQFERSIADSEADNKVDSRADSKADSASEGGENLWLGRLYCQAPEVDGAAIVVSDDEAGAALKPGTLVSGRITARRGFDLEVRIET